MRAQLALMIMLAATLGGCGSGGGTNPSTGDKTTTGIPGIEGEDRQVLVDLRRDACIGWLDAMIEYDRAQAERGCTCAIDRLLAGKSADELMASMGSNEQSDLERRTAAQCLTEGK